MTQSAGVVADRVGQSDVGERLKGKYLTFLVGTEEFGMRILKVNQIIQLQQITRVPRTPPFVRGVINLRGKVIPVIALRNKFGLEHREDDQKTCIVVAEVEGQHGHITMGIVIDEVREVLEIAASAIEETPEFGATVSTDFIMGMAKIGDKVKILLDIDRVLSANELAALEKVKQ